ncbi:hypothetical protein [Streptomyces sp. NBC_01506]|uniref:hypothetical protein n=1 Tax=Streptomyces sp. NBC_01506 TaxID=2903887 RepID=UPI00386B1F40
MISMVTAVTLSAVALTASSQVSGGSLDEFNSESVRFNEANCEPERDAPSDQPFMDCLFAYESAVQQDAASWSSEVAGRQADVEARGNMAIIFGLLGVTFAVCAVASNRGGRSGPAVRHPASGGAPAPARSPSQP